MTPPPVRRAAWIVWAALAASACDGGPQFQRPTTATSEGPIALREGQTLGGPARHLTVEDGPRFSGLAAVLIGSCSGAFVVPAGLIPEADGPAYVLTAGHCLWPAPPSYVGADLPLDPHFTVRFHDFSDSSGAAVEISTTGIAFVTMKGIDLAILQLGASRQALRRKGVVPFVLAEAPLDDGAEIAFAGHPRWTGQDGYAVLAACHQVRRAPLLLEQVWHWYDVEANDCQDAAPGASGSPVFSLASGHVVGVLNTRADENVQPPYPCVLNQPCEAGPDTIRFVPGTNYAIPVHGLGACFDSTGQFDRTGAGCPLDRGVQMQPTVDDVMLAAAPGTTLTAKVPLDAAGLTHYRAAIGPAATTDCRSAASYGPVTAHAAAPEIAATVPGDPGKHVVCVQAGPGPDPTAGWQDLRTPTMVIVTVE
jgi:hypothetical protein